jgi:methylenetetrahydrofolate dehydrogenase (NADP+)/methenyltetrahydrofolate cyclohydrolase
MILDGKLVASEIRKSIKQKVDHYKNGGLRAPCLAAILIEGNTASTTYVRNKIKTCEEVGFESKLINRNEEITQQELEDIIISLNEDNDIDGFILQLPVPKQIDVEKLTMLTKPEKDVDGFHPFNLGRMMRGVDTLLPATPLGILKLLEYYQIDTIGKNVVVVGRSNIVGTPISIMLSRPGFDATVTLAHSKTQNLKEVCKSADILIAAVGKAEFITKEYIKPGAVLIDVGINQKVSPKDKDKKVLCGDIAFDEVADIASYISPVPGGVGPLTIASLLLNTLKTYEDKFRLS